MHQTADGLQEGSLLQLTINLISAALVYGNYTALYTQVDTVFPDSVC